MLLVVALLISPLLLSGCLKSDVSTDERIILNAQTPTFSVPAESDYPSVEWYLDGEFEREDDPGEDKRVYYLLDRDNFQEGNYILRAQDKDSNLEWEFRVYHDVVSDEALEIETSQLDSSVANNRGYDHFTNIQERHKKAKEYWDRQ